MRAFVGLGCGCLGIALALSGCGGSTASELVNPGDAGAHGDATSQSHSDSGAKGDGSSTHADGNTGSHPGTDAGGHEAADARPDGPTKADAPNPGEDGSTGCPTAAPTAGSTCTTAEQVCKYGQTACECSFMKAWECATCPTTKPTAGSACTSATGGGMGGGGMGGADEEACKYGATDCACTADKWVCGSCPTGEPTAASACTVGGETCTYDGGACRCGRGGGMGMGGGGGGGGDEWRCDTGMGMGMMGMGATCPTAQPAAGTACTAGETCMYTPSTGDVTCVCSDLKFACN